MGLSIEGVAGNTYNLIDERSEDVSSSTDLLAAIDAGSFVVLDPRDPNGVTELSVADSRRVLQNHNQIHWGITGGRFGELDDPNVTLTEDHVVTIGPNGLTATTRPLAEVLSSSDNTEAFQDIVADMFASEGDITYDDATGTFTLEDNFLSNTGDTLDSGTLSIASGAAIAVGAGASLTVQDAPVNGVDAVNKAYVDSVANGMDHKESVQAATTADIGFTFDNNGGEGDTLTAASSGATNIDGVTLEDGDRVLIKNQANATQNGIYVVSGASGTTVLTRAEDQDGSVSNEISAGNTTFVEAGSTNGATGWIVTGDGELAVNTDDISWTQNTGQGTYSAAEGLELNGTNFAITTSNVSIAAGTVEAADEIIIGDASDSGATAKITIGDIFDSLDVVSGVTDNGFVVKTAEDTYASREIVAEPTGALGGIVVTNGDGVSDDPSIGLDIQGATANDGVDAADLVIAYDVTANENRRYSISEIANSSTLDVFRSLKTIGNATGDAGIDASGKTDTLVLSGGPGVSIDFDNSVNEVEFSITGNGISDASSVVGTDEVLVFNPSTGAPQKITFSDVLENLELVTAVVPSNVSGQQGLIVASSNAAMPVIGLDIEALDDSNDIMLSTDTFVINDGTDNVKISGKQVAQGVVDILDLPLTVSSDINGQMIITTRDETRNSKMLSIDSNSFMWSENSLANNDWVQIAGASDGDSGYIMPLDGTIVMATAHCENAGDASTINIYNGASTTPVAAAGSFTASPNAQFVNTTLDVDFVQGDRIRLRNVGGRINDTVISIFVKWRA